MKKLLIVIGAITFFVVMTGAVLPPLISTDKLPLLLIIFFVSSTAFLTGMLALFIIKRIQAVDSILHISLDEEDFRCLTRGGVLTIKNKARIMLKDIGFYKMEEAVMDAANGKETYKEHIRN